MLRLVEHLLYAHELIFGQKILVEYIFGELDCNLANICGFAIALLPDMLKTLRSDEHQFEITYFFDTVSDYAAHTGPMFNEIQLKFSMSVQRVGKFGLMSFHNVEAILAR